MMSIFLQVIVSLYYYVYCTTSQSIWKEPEIIKLTDESITYRFSVAPCDYGIAGKFNITARCFCKYDLENDISFDCSYPGPTLIMYSGTSPSVAFYNKFQGLTTDNSIQCNNGYCGLDIVNIHTHGLHISPFDDNVLIQIPPGSNHKFTYHIPFNHYPGIHWYHVHKHGSVAHQISMGLFGALIIDYLPSDSDSNYELKDYISNLLVFSWLYIATDCNCNNFEQTGIYTSCAKAPRGCFEIYSLCYDYCSFDISQRQASSFGTDYTDFVSVENSNQEQYFLVNGQLNPLLDDVSINKYRRLQFINTITSYYLQYDLPDECDWYLLGYDGIFFDDKRDLSNSPYFNQFIIAPGARAEVLFKCRQVGKHTVFTSQSSRADGLNTIERAPANIALFTIEVVFNGDDVNEVLPSSFPPKPEYLKDLRDENAVTSCPCNTWTLPRYKLWDLDSAAECGWAYNSKSGSVIVGVPWNPNQPFLGQVQLGDVTEFKMYTDRHVHHQHINPFQVQTNLADGFISQVGDWHDTLGVGNFENWVQRTYHADFDGGVIIHCHLIQHEDRGMMGAYWIADQDNNFCNIPEFHPPPLFPE